MLDDDLAASARRGDGDAFNRLVERYQDQVYSLCLRVLGDREAAADAAQEAFLSAYEAITSYRGGAFRAWLLRIATNACYDEFRRRQRRPASSLEDVVEADPGALASPDSSPEQPERAAEQHELRELLVQALLTLSMDQRTALVLHDVHGLDYAEVAAATGVALGTVKSRISRGRAELRKYLRARGEHAGTAGRHDSTSREE